MYNEQCILSTIYSFKTILVICAGDWTEYINPLSSFHHAGTEWEISQGGGQQLIADVLQLWGLGAGNKKQDKGVKWHRHSETVRDMFWTILEHSSLLHSNCRSRADNIMQVAEKLIILNSSFALLSQSVYLQWMSLHPTCLKDWIWQTQTLGRSAWHLPCKLWLIWLKVLSRIF